MKTIKIMITALLMCFTLMSFGQDNIKVTPNGITAVQMKSPHSDEATYQRIIQWVNNTYKNPNEVLTGNVQGKSVTISGYANNAWHYKSMGMEFYYNMSYHIYITINDSIVNFNFAEDNSYTSNGTKFLGSSRSFFKKDGEYRSSYNTAKSSLEATINNLWFSLFQKVTNSSMTSEEAIAELKKYKDKLDLGLITQEEYDKKKAELSKFIK